MGELFATVCDQLEPRINSQANAAKRPEFLTVLLIGVIVLLEEFDLERTFEVVALKVALCKYQSQF